MKATLDDVIHSYRIFMQRDPSTEELDIYNEILESNLDILDLKKIFLNSEEYNAIDGNFVKVECSGYHVFVSLKDNDFRSLIYNKTWEPHILNLIDKMIGDGDTFVDVGSNFGVMSFFASKKLGENGSVISFEPNPDNLNLFKRGIIYNKFNNITCLPIGLSDKKRMIDLCGTSNGYVDMTSESVDFSGNKIIQCLPGDELLLNSNGVDLIKIDVEGHDLHVIKGLEKTLIKFKPSVITEFNPRCIKNFSDLSCDYFVEQIYKTFEVVYSVSSEGDCTLIKDGNNLLRHWEEVNHSLTKNNILEDGVAHLDLVCGFDKTKEHLNQCS